jgi:hypothetical protein
MLLRYYVAWNTVASSTPLEYLIWKSNCAIVYQKNIIMECV